MSKKLDFSNLNHKEYAQEFAKSSLVKNRSWPPKEEVIPNISYVVSELLEKEIRSVLALQLKALQTTIYSGGIEIIINDAAQWDLGRKVAQMESPESYYNSLSDYAFGQLEEQAPGLLGGEDTCMWFSDQQ